MNYRSVMAIGRTRPVTDPGEKDAALRALVEHIVAGRSDAVRGRRLPGAGRHRRPGPAAGRGLGKVRTGPPSDDEPDYALPIWAGVLPLALTPGEPAPDPLLDPSIPTPDHVTSWSRPGS